MELSGTMKSSPKTLDYMRSSVGKTHTHTQSSEMLQMQPEGISCSDYSLESLRESTHMPGGHRERLLKCDQVLCLRMICSFCSCQTVQTVLPALA